MLQNKNVRIYKQMISGVVCLLNCFRKHNLKLMGQPLSKENIYYSLPCCCDNVFNVEHIQYIFQHNIQQL